MVCRDQLVREDLHSLHYGYSQRLHVAFMVYRHAPRFNPFKEHVDSIQLYGAFRIEQVMDDSHKRPGNVWLMAMPRIWRED